MRKYTKDELAVFYPVFCPSCGWKGLSRDTAGGGQIADTGDYDDIYCPMCVIPGGTEMFGKQIVLKEDHDEEINTPIEGV